MLSLRHGSETHLYRPHFPHARLAAQLTRIFKQIHRLRLPHP
jgi:hypothetical protein